MSQRTGTEATILQIAEEMELPIEAVEALIQVAQVPLSFDGPVNDDDDGTTIGDLLPDDDAASLVEGALDIDLHEDLRKALTTLTPREARIIYLRYGLQDGREHTLKEIGLKYGLTRERIRQIEKEALRKLRHPSRSRKLRSFLH